ncbi:hypothetical protein B0J13DRAFT_332597 [Dactylonectria estremocensis]|uniref:STE24 endopeptidase n=1 Tax=Dactylonectria estremocensis TaxID=1079267 RepID=A0A9P9EVM3_9HYPO|nr:hypothetical protein B0J13DRAFT_332597 [Dactylonectria estremocensis]
MPTALDNMMKSKVCPQTPEEELQGHKDTATSKTRANSKVENMVWAFGLVVAAATAKVIWGDEMFPPEKDPKGDPKTWTREELRRWLAARKLFPSDKDTKEELLERVQANMRRTNQ